MNIEVTLSEFKAIQELNPEMRSPLSKEAEALMKISTAIEPLTLISRSEVLRIATGQCHSFMPEEARKLRLVAQVLNKISEQASNPSQSNQS